MSAQTVIKLTVTVQGVMICLVFDVRTINVIFELKNDEDMRLM